MALVLVGFGFRAWLVLCQVGFCWVAIGPDWLLTWLAIGWAVFFFFWFSFGPSWLVGFCQVGYGLGWLWDGLALSQVGFWLDWVFTSYTFYCALYVFLVFMLL